MGRELGTASSYTLPFDAAFDFRPRNRENGEQIARSLPRSINDAQAAGETRNAGGAVAARQPLSGRGHDLPGPARPAAALLPRTSGPRRQRRGAAAARAGARLALRRPRRQHGVAAAYSRRLSRATSRSTPLKIGELWACPRCCVSCWSRICAGMAFRVNRSWRMRRTANGVADLVLTTADTTSVAASSAAYEPGARHRLRHAILFRLRDGSQSAGEALVWLENELVRSAATPRRSSSGSTNACSPAMSQPATSSAACGMINDIDWTEWFEAISRVDAVLRARTDFATLEFPSRDQYRTRDRGSRPPFETQRILSHRPRAPPRRGRRGGQIRSARPHRHRLLAGRFAPRGTGAGDRLPSAFGTAIRPRAIGSAAGRASPRRLRCSPRCFSGSTRCGARRHLA